MSSLLRGEGPEGPVADHVQTEIPGFRALARQILPVDDFEAAVHQIGFVIVHRFKFYEHSLLDRSDEFTGLCRRETRSLEPIGKRKSAT